jgi:hypothetical protein
MLPDLENLLRVNLSLELLRQLIETLPVQNLAVRRRYLELKGAAHTVPSRQLQLKTAIVGNGGRPQGRPPQDLLVTLASSIARPLPIRIHLDPERDPLLKTQPDAMRIEARTLHRTLKAAAKDRRWRHVAIGAVTASHF